MSFLFFESNFTTNHAPERRSTSPTGGSDAEQASPSTGSRALAAFGGTVPEDRNERESMLDDIFTDEINDILSKCDSEFYEHPDNLELLSYQFIFRNKDQFTRA